MTASYPRLDALQERINYQFQQIDLAVMAMTHRSYGDGQRSSKDNERLEFLGDRVLGLLTAQALYAQSDAAEGTLARRLNALVRKESCADIARRIKLGEAVLLSTAEERQGGRDKTSILGDVCEALLGAIYLDGGLAAAQDFYTRFWGPLIEEVSQVSAKDSKTELQERAMQLGPDLPAYKVVERSGPDHDPIFVIEVSVKTVGSAQGKGKSKRDAERAAASALLSKWKT